MKKRILAGLLSLMLLLELFPVSTAAMPETSKKTVYFTLSNDGAILLGNDEAQTRLSRVPVCVPYFDLALYGLEAYYRYEADSDGYVNDTLIQAPTVLHLLIYMLERYYYGLEEDDCCKGKEYLAALGIRFGAPAASGARDELGRSTGKHQGFRQSGSATALYLPEFWGHDENLMYYVNHAYPLMQEGKGATADYLLLNDGDVIDLAMFTDRAFYKSGAFGQMEPEVSEIAQGTELSFRAYGVATATGLNGETKPRTEAKLNWSVRNAEGLVLASSQEPTSSFCYRFEEGGDFTVVGCDPQAGSKKARVAPAVASVRVRTSLRFALEPQDAIIQLFDNAGARLWPSDDGSYSLVPGDTYRYIVTRNGYIGQENRFVAKKSGTVVVTLIMAEKNEEIDRTVYAQWGSFRKNGLAVTDAETPYSSADTELLWAESYGDAITAPILVDGDLITCCGDRLLRLDRSTGSIKAEGRLAARSESSTVPTTYAEGMIFVGLSEGKVQAFNAVTLKSLWIYTDPCGGQSNCPITYKDGYLYLGFCEQENSVCNYVCLSTSDELPTEQEEEKLATWTYAHKGGFYWAGAYASDKYLIVGTGDRESDCGSETADLLVFDRLTGKLMDEATGFRGGIHSDVTYDAASDRVFFTTKGGQLCNAKINWTSGKIFDVQKTVITDANGAANAMSNSTPAVYNSRIYIGVSGQDPLEVASGHAINVYNLEKDGSMTLVDSCAVRGCPQSSVTLSTGYEKESGYVYAYLPTACGICVLKDRKGQSAPLRACEELFTPDKPQTQFCTCSVIADEYGTLYYQNDSNCIMALTSKVESIAITSPPNKLRYDGEAFEPEGMEVVAKLKNGAKRDITSCVTWKEEVIPLTQTSLTLRYTYGSEAYGRSTKTVELPLNRPAADARVFLLAQAGNAFLTAPKTVEVSSALAESYGYADKVPVLQGVSALDVLVRAHELIYGDAFTAQTATRLLSVGEDGAIKTVFSMKTQSCGFTVNGVSLTDDEKTSWGGNIGLTVNEATVNNGDEVSFFLYQNADAMDLYGWFLQDQEYSKTLTAEASIPTKLTLEGYHIGLYGCDYKDLGDILDDVKHTAAIADAQLALVDANTGALTDLDGAVTDKEGKVTVSFPEAGAYLLTAYVPAASTQEKSSMPVIMPLAHVIIKQHTHSYRTTVIAPTFDEVGYTLHSCTRCGDSYRDTETKPLGHKCLAFADLPNDWARRGVCFVVENGLMNGMSKTYFAPEACMERGMLITVLYRLAGSPAVSGQLPFSDVMPGCYYERPVLWASQVGIVKGISATTLAPTQLVSREQTVAMLHRYAKYSGVDTKTSADLSSYADAAAISDFAKTPMAWAVAEGLIFGTARDRLSPAATASRAEIAAILMRFMKATMK